MKLIIDIPEKMYKEYVSVNLARGNGKTITDNLLKAIKNGTPLPKGQAIIKADLESAYDCGYNCGYADAMKKILQTGKWIEKEDYNLDTYYECSECGADYYIEGDILIHKYCPNCGARMAEAESEE